MKKTLERKLFTESEALGILKYLDMLDGLTAHKALDKKSRMWVIIVKKY